MKKFVFLLPILLYLLILFFTQKQIFTYQFNQELPEKYLLSQDIPEEVPGKRLFLSDGEIHQAAAYYYINGEDPTTYNFQHPPLLKYWFGIGIKFFNNPLIMQVILGIAYLVITFYFGKIIFKSAAIGLVASSFLAIDPLLSNVSSAALLDLGQAVFILLYLFFILNKDKLSKLNKFLLPGIALGLIAGSKFWAGALFFYGLSFLYEFLNNFKKSKIKIIKNYALQGVVAFFTLSIIYLPAFINQGFKFNFIFFQLKLLKYWFNHSVTSVPLASLMLFVSGYFKSWWNNNLMQSKSWIILWPISLVINLFLSIKLFLKTRKINKIIFVLLLPLIYLIYLGIQAPFDRYFILILPFLYLGLAKFIVIDLFKN
jgi:predicted membrane-bound dolichyl-phosphate-mannose-protein mannosyltransferase